MYTQPDALLFENANDADDILCPQAGSILVSAILACVFQQLLATEPSLQSFLTDPCGWSLHIPGISRCVNTSAFPAVGSQSCCAALFISACDVPAA